MFGNNNTDQKKFEKRIFFSTKNGKFLRTDGSGETYDYIEGRLSEITKKPRTFNGEEVQYWYVDMRDAETGELYTVTFPYSSGVYKSLIMSLAGSKTLYAGSNVKLSIYERDGLTKLAVYEDGRKLDWVQKTLPAVRTVMVGSKEVKDDTERMAFIESLTVKTNEQLSGVIYN